MSDGTMSTILMLVLMAVAFYFLLIRPAQRKQKDQQNMVSQLQPGARVLTTAGVFSTVRHLGTNQVIVEIAPGVEMTLMKQAIMRIVKPSEDEFEYEDGADAAGDSVDAVDGEVVESAAPEASSGGAAAENPDPSTR